MPGSQHMPKIYSFEDVKIAGSIDDTLDSIRRGVTHTPTSLDDPSQPTGKRARDDEDSEGFLHMRTTPGAEMKDFVADRHAKPPHARIFSRLLMETYGWPIKCFKDIPELLCVVRDAIQGKLDRCLSGFDTHC